MLINAYMKYYDVIFSLYVSVSHKLAHLLTSLSAARIRSCVKMTCPCDLGDLIIETEALSFRHS